MVRVPTIDPLYAAASLAYVVYVLLLFMCFAMFAMVKALSAHLWFGFRFYSSRRLSHLLVLALLLSDNAPLYALPTSVAQQSLLWMTNGCLSNDPICASVHRLMLHKYD